MAEGGAIQTEEKASLAKTMPKDILHGLGQSIILVNKNNIIENVYGGTEAFFQRSSENLTGIPINKLKSIGLPTEDLIIRSRGENVPLNSYDVKVNPAIDDVGLVDLHAQPFGDNGSVILTIQPRRITAFLERRDDMEAAARSVSGLASMLAHEIKNPLSGIRGAAQLLGRSGDDTSLRMTELICKEVDRIKGLVDELESFSLSDPQDLTAINIHEVLDHVLSVSIAGFASRARIRPIFDPSLPPVRGNFDRLVQVFLNLVKNAIEASGPDVELTIKTSYRHGIWFTNAEGKRVRLPIEITVQDNGPGIPDNIRSHLFDPFVSGKEGGTGLGLALVARFISEMGGTVTCDNLPNNGGAIFKVQLALDEDETQ